MTTKRKRRRSIVRARISQEHNRMVRKNRKPMRQILLRESELGRRYTELGNFSKSADLKSLFTESADESANLLMWYRLSALACRPMQEAGADSLKALAGLRRAAKVHSRYGPKSPESVTPMVNAKGLKWWEFLARHFTGS